jgi:hypothetical protein
MTDLEEAFTAFADMEGRDHRAMVVLLLLFAERLGQTADRAGRGEWLLSCVIKWVAIPGLSLALAYAAAEWDVAHPLEPPTIAPAAAGWLRDHVRELLRRWVEMHVVLSPNRRRDVQPRVEKAAAVTCSGRS